MTRELDPSVKLPFSWVWPLVAGALAGLAMRLLFWGDHQSAFSVMSGTFIFLSPMIVGAITVYVAETKARRSWVYYFVAPVFANVFYVSGTLLILIEGLICAVVIVPLFAGIGGLGGLAMGAVCRVTRWPKQTLLGFCVLPLVVGPLEQNVPLPNHVATVERSVLVQATPEVIWRQIMHAPNIRPEEIEAAWLYRIGVPLPTAGVVRETAGGRMRRVTMGRGIYFDEVITDWDENRYVRWTYRFHEDSFPPGTLDEHVVIGGNYFDVVDTAYVLTPREGSTEVTMRMRYRVSTRFNWYADPVARFLMTNLEESNLEYYRRRSESRLSD